jgi:hypothetical protein
MLARTLGAHSAIMAFNDLYYFGSFWDPYDNARTFSPRELADHAANLLARQTNGLWGGRPTEVENAWGRRLVRDLRENECTPAGVFAAVLQRLAQDAGKPFACERTPRNIFYARRLLELYPNARVVHIVRDPRSVLASQKNRWKHVQLGSYGIPVMEMLRSRVNYHSITMSKLWARATEEALSLEGHARFMLVRFEDVVADHAAGARRLCAFLGLQFEPEMIDVPRWGTSPGEQESDSNDTSPEVINRWRESLSPGEILICERINHRMMLRFGYTPELLGRQPPPSRIPSMLTYPLHVAGVLALNPVRAWKQLRAMMPSRAKGRKD